MAYRAGDVATGRGDDNGPRHAVVNAEKYGEWWPICQCRNSDGWPVSVTTDELVDGPVTCQGCQRTYRQLKKIMEGK